MASYFLAGVFVESVSLGIHISTYVVAIKALVNTRTIRNSSMLWCLTVATTSALMVIGTIDAIFSAVLQLQWTDPLSESFTLTGQIVTVGVIYSTTCSLFMQRQTIDFYLAALIGDGFMVSVVRTFPAVNHPEFSVIGQIYRLYAITSRNRMVCVLPCVLWFGQTAAFVSELVLFKISTPDNDYLWFPFDVLQSACTLAINLFATGTSTLSARVSSADQRSLCSCNRL